MARAQCPETPFLFISGTIGEETAIEALKQGATDYVLKDHMGRLVPSVLRALNEAKERQERKRAQEALCRQERFLANVLTSIQDGIVALNKDYVILLANPTMDLWYAQAGPLVGRKCYEVFHCRTSPCEKCPSRRVFETGAAASETVADQSDAGQVVRWLEISSFPLTDGPSGPMTGAIEYIRDITQRKKSEEQLRLQTALLKRVQETSVAQASAMNPEPESAALNGKGESPQRRS
jgi:PAS domain S-box-containing protein